MPNTITKNLHHCFSIIKQHRPQPPQLTHHHHHHHHNHHPDYSPSQPTTTTATTTTTTTFIKNYNSLYEDDFTTASPSTASDTDMAEAAPPPPMTPDLTAVYASRRFFISSPGRSNSIVDSLSLPSSPEEEETPAVAGGVPVMTYSPDPYVDFRKSMQQMVEARDVEGVHDGKDGWDYLQELLLSYLSLNPKSTHKYIVGAFADLVITLMSPTTNNNGSSSSFSSSPGGGDDV